jgi:hypothetical protein
LGYLVTPVYAKTGADAKDAGLTTADPSSWEGTVAALRLLGMTPMASIEEGLPDGAGRLRGVVDHPTRSRASGISVANLQPTTNFFLIKLGSRAETIMKESV